MPFFSFLSRPIAVNGHSYARNVVAHSRWSVIWWPIVNSMPASGHTFAMNAAKVLHRRTIWSCIRVSTVRWIRSCVRIVVPHFRANSSWSTMAASMVACRIRVLCVERNFCRSGHLWPIWGCTFIRLGANILLMLFFAHSHQFHSILYRFRLHPCRERLLLPICINYACVHVYRIHTKFAFFRCIEQFIGDLSKSWLILGDNATFHANLTLNFTQCSFKKKINRKASTSFRYNHDYCSVKVKKTTTKPKPKKMSIILSISHYYFSCSEFPFKFFFICRLLAIILLIILIIK